MQTEFNRVPPVPQDSPLPPLVVDLDGCLIKTDLLIESCLLLLRENLFSALLLPFWLLRGKAHLKAEVAKRVGIEAALLPYSPSLLLFLREQRAAGRKLILATAANQRLAAPVAGHLAIFDCVLASDDSQNLSGERKLAAIRQVCKGEDFDYAGNAMIDLKIWPHARRALVVNPHPGVQTAARRQATVERVFQDPPASLKDYLKAVRVHQWLKNLLLFVPLFTAHAWRDGTAVTSVLLAFAAFSLCASSTYIFNDLLDLPADRAHPRKRKRPFAAGSIPVARGLAMAVLLMLAGLALAASINLPFLGFLLLYIVITVTYSLHLKSYVLIDTMVLAGLYTLRVIAGGAAAAVLISFWLLAFSMFIFLSLAMVKRCSELKLLGEAGKLATRNRDYRVSDLPGISAMGTASGYLGVLVLALYLQSPDVVKHYSHPEALWLLCPLFLYWISRMWLKAGRGEMHEDPLVYTVLDRASRYLVVASAVVVVLAV